MIILIVQQNYYSDLYPAKILDLSSKLFFPCMILQAIRSIWFDTIRFPFREPCARGIIAQRY